MATDESKKDALFKNVTRYTSAEEREKIERIELNDEDIHHFMELLKNGLIEAASVHDAAVQDNMALSAEFSVKLSRPVYNEKTDSVESLSGKSEINSVVRARKVFKKK